MEMNKKKDEEAKIQRKRTLISVHYDNAKRLPFRLLKSIDKQTNKQNNLI